MRSVAGQLFEFAAVRTEGFRRDCLAQQHVHTFPDTGTLPAVQDVTFSFAVRSFSKVPVQRYFHMIEHIAQKHSLYTGFLLYATCFSWLHVEPALAIV